MLDLCLADSRILYFWQVLESIHKFIIELYPPIFVRGSNKKQRRGRIILNFTKRETLFVFYDNQVLLGVISRCGFPSCTLQKRPSSSLQFCQEENIPGHSIERRAYWFVLKISRMFPISMSRNRMRNAFIIINITPKCKR